MPLTTQTAKERLRDHRIEIRQCSQWNGDKIQKGDDPFRKVFNCQEDENAFITPCKCNACLNNMLIIINLW